MKIRNTCIYITLFLLLLACDRADVAENNHISLKASIGEMNTVSKGSTSVAAPYEGTSPADSTLVSDVWFSKSASYFPHNPSGDPATNLPCHTTMTFTSDAATYADYKPAGQSVAQTLKYPINGDDVYCVGFHPQSDPAYPKAGWYTEDGINVSHPINGCEDLMFAGIISGDWNNHFQTQSYKHLLTWVKVSVCAMTMETARQWGKVTKVTISSKDSLNINLSTNPANVTYDYTKDSPKILTVYDDEATGTELSLTSKVIGSAFCSPMTVSVPVIGNDGKPTGANKTVAGYEVSITTEHGGTKTIPVTLSDLDYVEITDPASTVGKLYILSLYFNPFNIIEGTCTLNYWNGQNEDLYLTPSANQNNVD